MYARIMYQMSNLDVTSFRLLIEDGSKSYDMHSMQLMYLGKRIDRLSRYDQKNH